MGLQIEVDRERCIGSGNCAFYAPATFDIDDDLRAVVLPGAGGPDADADGAVLQSADGCPTRAIRVSRDGVVVFPA